MNYKDFPVGALWTNCYIFWDDNSKQAFCVDPGGDTHEIREFLTAQGLKLTMILITHGHIDHIAGISELVPFVGNNSSAQKMLICCVIHQQIFRHYSVCIVRA